MYTQTLAGVERPFGSEGTTAMRCSTGPPKEREICLGHYVGALISRSSRLEFDHIEADGIRLRHFARGTRHSLEN